MGRNYLLLIYVLQLTLCAIGDPLPVLGATSSVIFTRYKRVSSSEWEDFYRDRGVTSRPIIPGRIRPREIPVVHYSYTIEHSPLQNRLCSKETTPNDSTVLRVCSRTCRENGSPIVFEDDQIKDESSKLTFPTHQEEDSKIYFPMKWRQNTQNDTQIATEVDPRKRNHEANTNFNQLVDVQEPKIRLNETSTVHSMKVDDHRDAKINETQKLEEDTRLTTRRKNSASIQETLTNPTRNVEVDVNSLIDEFTKYLELNPAVSTEILKSKFTY